MKTIQTKLRIGSDGVLTLKLPSGMADTDLDVIVIMQPVGPDGPKPVTDPEEWKRFVEETAGCWQGEPLVRPDQGEFEIRKEWT